jgi:hypothetical protein
LIRSYNLPVGALMVENGEKLKQVKYWLKFHVVLKSGDIQEVYQELIA